MRHREVQLPIICMIRWLPEFLASSPDASCLPFIYLVERQQGKATSVYVVTTGRSGFEFVSKHELVVCDGIVL